MKYEDMTDFEINKAVATLWLECDYDFDDNQKTVDLVGYQTYLGAYGIADERLEKYGEFNPLKDASDAWPIILKSKISIVFDEHETYVNQGAIESYPWVKHERQVKDDENPLRAAMIIYLMMQGEL